MRKQAPTVWAIFVLYLGCSLFLIFSEQKAAYSTKLAVIQQPGSLSLAPNAAMQGFFIGDISFLASLLLLIVLSIAILRIKSSLPIDDNSVKAHIARLEDELNKKEDFIAMASHELKTPLSSLKIYTQALEMLMKSRNHPEYGQYMKKIDTQITRLSRLVSTLLDIARLESGKITYAKKNFDLCALIEVVAEDMRMLGNNSISVEGTLPRPAYGDKDRIAQVIENLISNGIKYSSAQASIEIRISPNGEMAIVSVTDHGIGIDEKYHKDIFKRFFRINRDIEGSYSGMGVGLFISCEIIEQHGGNLWLTSTKGVGSTFYFSLPLAKNSP